VSADLKGIAKVWDARTLKLRREVNSYSAALNATALSRDSRFLVTAGADLLIWDIETGARLQALSRPGGLYAASMSAGGQTIARWFTPTHSQMTLSAFRLAPASEVPGAPKCRPLPFGSGPSHRCVRLLRPHCWSAAMAIWSKAATPANWSKE
jgi:hypothetical protein